MNDEEKRVFAQKDLEEKLRAVMRRFLEGMIDRDQLLDDYGNINADRRHKRLIFADLVIQEFEVSAQNERVFALMELLGADAGAGFLEEAKALKTRFLKELETREAGIRKSIAGRLHDLGISGSAVEPNAADWDEWKAGAREAAALFRRHLSEWKERMSAGSQ